MAHRKAHFETQLNDVNTAIAARTKLLVERKLDAKAQKRDTIYKALVAKSKAFKTRIKAIDAMLALNTATELRKAERLATPKVPKAKKKKVVAPVKAKKGGGGGGGEGKKPKAEKAEKAEKADAAPAT